MARLCIEALLAAFLAAGPGSGPDAATAPAPPQVTPFRTELKPRVDPVFGDAAALRASVDRFVALQGEMDRVREEFSTAVHETLSALAPPSAAAPKACPAPAATSYARALSAGARYLQLGQQLQGRFREIRRADDLGDAAALTPDYRAKIKKVRELFQALLVDYREMRVAFYDQLGAEMRRATCKTGKAAGVTGAPDAAPEEAPPNPTDADAWALDDGATTDEPRPPAGASPKVAPRAAEPTSIATPGPASVAAPAIWIDVDNTLCAQPTRVSVDGQPLGEVGARKRTSVRTHAGPREICALPASDPRACGAPGTVRKAYLHEGWSLTVHCAE